MNVVCINIEDKKAAKDMIIKAAIKLGFQYVEMEDEVIIEYDYLFRFVEKEDVFIGHNLIEVLNKPFGPSDFKIDLKPLSSKGKLEFPKRKKNEYKIESKRVKSKVKTKIDYNRRKY